MAQNADVVEVKIEKKSNHEIYSEVINCQSCTEVHPIKAACAKFDKGCPTAFIW